MLTDTLAFLACTTCDPDVIMGIFNSQFAPLLIKLASPLPLVGLVVAMLYRLR